MQHPRTLCRTLVRTMFVHLKDLLYGQQYTQRKPCQEKVCRIVEA